MDEINSQSHAPQGLGIEGRSDHPSQSNSHVARSINDGYNDDNFSYNEVEDVEIDDEMSTDGDFYAQRNASANPQFGGVSGTTNITNNQASQTNNSLTSRSTSKKNYKSSTSSSKLRSTTSKLFDKKGSQPRRYSIIPVSYTHLDVYKRQVPCCRKDSHRTSSLQLQGLCMMPGVEVLESFLSILHRYSILDNEL